MLFLPIRKIGTDGLRYRPDEEMPQGFFAMQDDRADLANDDEATLVARLTPREIALYGFLAGVLGAVAAAVAGFAMATSWPIQVTTLAGAILASAGGWFALRRPG